MTNPFLTARTWQQAHPYAAGWIVFRALRAALFAVCITSPPKLFGFISGGRLTEWARQHEILALILGMGVPLLILDWLFKRVAPLLDKPQLWPLSDQQARFHIQRRLKRIPLWVAILALFGALLLAGGIAFLLHHAWSYLAPMNLLIFWLFFLLSELRPQLEPAPPAPFRESTSVWPDAT